MVVTHPLRAALMFVVPFMTSLVILMCLTVNVPVRLVDVVVVVAAGPARLRAERLGDLSRDAAKLCVLSCVGQERAGGQVTQNLRARAAARVWGLLLSGGAARDRWRGLG